MASSQVNDPYQHQINELKSKFNDKCRFVFKSIGTSELSSSNNPISIADEAVATYGIEVIYVGVGGNSNHPSSTPYGYCMYEIRHYNDTVIVNVIDYQTGAIKTRGRARSGSWTAWKTFSVQ